MGADINQFDRSAVEAADLPWARAASVNNALMRLADQRHEQVDLADETLARSKLAWKLAVLRQALIHRLVDLASSTCLEWNQGNSLASIILARAAFETCALIEYIAHALGAAVESEDIEAIDGILMTQTFATRIPGWLADGEFPTATNILTAIQRLDKSLPGAAGHYDRLSDFAHPNSQGTHQFYASTNKQTATVTFSREKRGRAEIFEHVVAAVATLAWARRRLDELDQRVQQISDLQRRTNPVR